MAKLEGPKPGDRICAPTCGAGGLLIKAAEEVAKQAGDDKQAARNFALFGQESNGSTWALCRMNIFLHSFDSARVEWCDTLKPDDGRKTGVNTGLTTNERIQPNHFSQVGKMVNLGSGSEREIEDYQLSRYACYLIVQNGAPSKPAIANGQTYSRVLGVGDERIRTLNIRVPWCAFVDKNRRLKK